jgi:hypothetical protein
MESSPPPAFQSKSSDCTNIEMSAQHPNTMPPIHYVQPYSARLTSPPSDYLVWSIVSTVCSGIFSFWA